MAVKKGEPGKLAEGRELEVKHVAETTDLSPKQARDLLEKYGNDFERIRKEAKNWADLEKSRARKTSRRHPRSLPQKLNPHFASPR